MTKFAFSGRLRAGKDYSAHQIGCDIVSFAQPIYQIAQHYMGSDDKDVPDIRKFMQLVGAWGRGEATEGPKHLPARADVTQFLRSSAPSILEDRFGSVDWKEFGTRDDFWINIVVQRAEQNLRDNPDAKIAVVNARFENEVEALKRAGFQHFHVKCSTQTRIERIGGNYHPEMENDVTEQMAVRMDETMTGPAVIWNDHRSPEPGRGYTQLKDFVRQYGSNTTALPLPSTLEAGASRSIDGALQKHG